MVKFVGLGLASLTLKARAEPAPAPETGMSVGVFNQLSNNGHDAEASLFPVNSFVGTPVGLTPMMPVMSFGSARPAKMQQHVNPFSAKNRFQENYTPYVAPSFESHPESQRSEHAQAFDIRPPMQGAPQGAPPMMGNDGAPQWAGPVEPSNPFAHQNSFNAPVNNPFENPVSFYPNAGPEGHPGQGNSNFKPESHFPNAGHGGNDFNRPPPMAPMNHDMEHAKSIDLANPGVVQGYDVINSINYRTDGNYKMEINMKGSVPLKIVDLVAGKCSAITPGVSIVNAENTDTTLEIDLSICQEECDLAPNEILSSIDVLNQPLNIQFGIADPQQPENIIAQYNIQPAAWYNEDYILEFDTGNEETRQLVIDDEGEFFQIDDNIQFSYMTYNDPDFEMKTYSTKQSAPPGQTTFMEMCPINGFTVGKMINVPEICFIKDLSNGNTVMMWDMGMEAENGCIPNLKYKTDKGAWQFPANYYQIFGYNTRHQGNHNNFKITCNMRVCGNVYGNPCQAQIERCPEYIR